MSNNNNNNSPLASCTGRITVIKDGEDGIGIIGADTVFAVYSSKTAAPAEDFEGWKTLYSELVLLPDAYIWTAIRITNTKKHSWLTGIRCLGSCKDFADIKELYALGDSGTSAPTSGWKESWSPVKGKYLWAKNELTLQGVAEKMYTDPVCVGYFAVDGINGTGFEPKGKANAHYVNYEEYISTAQDPIPDELYLVDTVTDSEKYANVSGPVCISYDKLITGNEVVTRAEKGDAYIIGKDIWMNNGTAWVDMGDIQGPEGESGKDAPWVVYSNNPVVFETDDKGKAQSASKLVDMMVYLGTEIITNECSFALEAAADGSYDVSKASLGGTSGETATLTVNADGIKTKQVEGYDISLPNSSLCVRVTYGEYVIKVTINIVTDTSLVDGYFRTSVKGLEARYTDMKSVVDGNTSLLKTHQSEINANAEAIGTKVSQSEYDSNNSRIGQQISSITQTATKISERVEAVDKQGKTTQAELDMCVEKQEDGTYISKMKMYADYLTLSANHILDIQGNYININTTNFKVDTDGNVSLTGKVNATSGNIGDLILQDGSLVYVKDNLSYKITKDHFEYTDISVPCTLYGGKVSDDGIVLSLSTDEADFKIFNNKNKQGVGAYISKGNFNSYFSPAAFAVGYKSVEVTGMVTHSSVNDMALMTVGSLMIYDEVDSNGDSTYRGVTSGSDMKLYDNSANNIRGLVLGAFKIKHDGSTGKTLIDAASIPEGFSRVSKGQIYQESDGTLKVRLA